MSKAHGFGPLGLGGGVLRVNLGSWQVPLNWLLVGVAEQKAWASATVGP